MLMVSACCHFFFSLLYCSEGMSLIKTGRQNCKQMIRRGGKNILVRKRINTCCVDCLMKKYVEQQWHYKCFRTALANVSMSVYSTV